LREPVCDGFADGLLGLGEGFGEGAAGRARVAAAAELFGEHGGVERGARPNADPRLGIVILVAVEEKRDAVSD